MGVSLFPVDVFVIRYVIFGYVAARADFYASQRGYGRHIALFLRHT